MRMIAGSLQAGEWFFHVGGVNEKVCRGRSWKGTTLVLEGWIRDMKEEYK